MNQQIIDYLQQNKASYTKEVLIQQLRNSGYGENDIQEAINFIYNTANASDVVPASSLNNATPTEPSRKIKLINNVVISAILTLPVLGFIAGFIKCSDECFFFDIFSRSFAGAMGAILATIFLGNFPLDEGGAEYLNLRIYIPLVFLMIFLFNHFMINRKKK